MLGIKRIVSGFCSAVYQKYNNLLLTSPFKTKTITAGIISMIGDTLCQKVIERKSSSEHSLRRTFNQSIVSSLYGAPVGHVWFGKILPTLIAPVKNRTARILSSVVLDNTLFSSVNIINGVFLLELLKSRDAKASMDNVQLKFSAIFWNSMKFWSTVSLINHIFVPIHFKVFVNNICGVVWQIYMSYMIHSHHAHQLPLSEPEMKREMKTEVGVKIERENRLELYSLDILAELNLFL